MCESAPRIRQTTAPGSRRGVSRSVRPLSSAEGRLVDVIADEPSPHKPGALLGWRIADGEAHALAVAKLARLSRSVRDLADLAERTRPKGTHKGWGLFLLDIDRHAALRCDTRPNSGVNRGEQAMIRVTTTNRRPAALAPAGLLSQLGELPSRRTTDRTRRRYEALTQLVGEVLCDHLFAGRRGPELMGSRLGAATLTRPRPRASVCVLDGRSDLPRQRGPVLRARPGFRRHA